MGVLICSSCKRERKVAFSIRAEQCECGGTATPRFTQQRSELRQVSAKREKAEAGLRKPAKRSTLKRGRGFAASPAQQAKAREIACIVTGAQAVEGATVDPAHLCPRGMGGCDDPFCVLPLRRDKHEAFDAGELDLLPYLRPHYAPDLYAAEIAHALAHYDWSLLQLLHRLTGERHLPESEVDRLVDARLAA